MKNALTKSLDDPFWKRCRWFRPIRMETRCDRNRRSRFRT